LDALEFGQQTPRLLKQRGRKLKSFRVKTEESKNKRNLLLLGSSQGREISPMVQEYLGTAVAQAVSGWFPTAAARVRVRAGMWSLWWTKRLWGKFFPSTSVSPANHHFTNFIITITRGWHNGPIGGRSVEWTHLVSTPH
jgi:hypothetical protein